MTKFENKSFSVGVGETSAYRDGWERIWGKKDDKPVEATPAPTTVPLVEEKPKKPRKKRKTKSGT